MQGQLSIGDVLQTSLTVIQRNVGTFLLLIAIIVVPNIVLTIGSGVLMHFIMPELLPPAGTVPNPEAMLQQLSQNMVVILPIYFLTILVLTVTYAIAQAGMTFTTVEHMAGRTANALSALTAASRSIVSLLVASFLVGFVTMIGSLMCIVPGVFAVLFFCLTAPAILVERLGPIAGMQRSIELTEGHKLNIFLIFLVFFVAVMVLSFCVIAPVNMALTLATLTPGTMPDPLGPGQIVANLLSTIINGALSAFATTTVAVIYAKIRGIRDGVDAEAFARVFA